VPALPSWLTNPLWDQFAALLPIRPTVTPTYPLGCHRRRISDRIVFDKLIQVLRFGCSYQAIADTTCSATTIRNRRDEWIKLGIFARLKQIALDAYDRIVGLLPGQQGPLAVPDRPAGHVAADPHRGDRAGDPHRQAGWPDLLGLTPLITRP
jgi:transposase